MLLTRLLLSKIDAKFRVRALYIFVLTTCVPILIIQESLIIRKLKKSNVRGKGHVIHVLSLGLFVRKTAFLLTFF